MRHTALDTAYDRNQLQTLFVMLAGVRASKPMLRQSVEPKPAAWWHKAKAKAKAVARHRNAFGNRYRKNPQCAASPLVSRGPEEWRAPSTDRSEQFFAVLGQMGARHQAAARRDHLIAALEGARSAKRVQIREEG